MPLVSFFKSTKRSNKENVPQFKQNAKAPDPSTYIPSPYSVVTQPKKVKGPQSCPGAPMDDVRTRARERPFTDRYSQLNNSIRYENLPRKRMNSFEADSCRGHQASKHPHFKEGRNGYDSHFQYESFESEDDDYQNFKHMQTQIAELTRDEKKMREKYRDYKRRLEESYEEAEYYRRNFERQSHAFEKVRRTLENERKQRAIAEYKNKELTDAYKQANERIMDLEEKLNFFERSVDDHSLLQEGGASGAGEALCEQSDLCSRDLVNSDTPSVSMFSGGIADQEKDEVRVFHLQDSDDCDMDDEIEAERSVKASPLETPSSNFSGYKPTSAKFGKSLSDTNLQCLTSTVKEEAVSAKFSNGDWINTFRNLSVTDKEHDLHHDSPYISSSDDDEATDLAFQQQQYEKQLRKVGDAVKYKPPRKIIEEKYFRRYAKPERTAIETLNFLDDMSSDASGLLSSPDFSTVTAQFR